MVTSDLQSQLPDLRYFTRTGNSSSNATTSSYGRMSLDVNVFFQNRAPSQTNHHRNNQLWTRIKSTLKCTDDNNMLLLLYLPLTTRQKYPRDIDKTSSKSLHPTLHSPRLHHHTEKGVKEPSTDIHSADDQI